MVIDIDIKIANSNGKLIHRFSKQFDEKLEVSEKIEKDTGLSKDFEDFLTEYLSASGRSVREKLISYTDMPADLQSNMYLTEAGDSDPDGEGADRIPDSEMEYKIRIGNNKVIAGKIPFHRLSRLNAVADVLDKADREYEEASGKNGALNRTDHTGLYANHLSDPRSKEIVVDLERNLKNLMIQAVEKYESNFYHTDEEKVAD